MLRRALLLWVAMVASLPALLAVSSTKLGLQFADEAFIDSRLPTISGCFGRDENGRDNPWSQDLCTFGPRMANRRLLVVGDSTVASMTDGVVSAATSAGVNVVSFPSRGCTFTSRFPHSYSWCEEYFKNAIGLIASVQPDGLIVSNYLSRMDLSDRRIPFSNGRLPQSRWSRLESTILALNEALKSARNVLPEMPILIVQEVPTVPFRRPSLLFNKVNSPQVSKYSRGFMRQREYISAVEGVASAFKNVSTIDPEKVFCGNSYCSAKNADGEWLYMDSYHLNPRGSNLLTSEFKSWITKHVLAS